ncbi:MAG: OmpA family protein [bacterium]|nr:OmpA family protein [bacterium]
MRPRSLLVLIATLFAFAVVAPAPAAAQFGKLKDKVKDKVERKVDQKTDKAIDKALEGPSDQGKDAEASPPAPADEAGEPVPASGTAGTGKAGSGSAAAEDMTLYTKYDFVPGDKVIFYDDLAREEVGEFPSRWNLKNGVFEIARTEGSNWILCTDKGAIMPKLPLAPLPDKYTVELEFFSAAHHDGWYAIQWLDAAGDECGQMRIGYSSMTSVIINDKPLASKDLPDLPRGRHVMRIMATKSTIKCYIDQERIANIPKVEGFAPVGFRIDMNPYFDNENVSLIGAFRFAEGGKTLREQLDEAGVIVTHGILFDSGSDRIKAESYKTLTDIGTMLTEDTALRLSIEGHTDADGADDANLKLSQARAASVRAYLAEKHGVDAGRLETRGHGEGKPIDTNDTPEGKANNRRVELVKL